MKTITLSFITLMPYFIWSSEESNKLKISVEILKNQISYLEPLPFKVKVTNLSKTKKSVYELFPEQTVMIEIRKQGEKNWDRISGFSPQRGFVISLHDYPKMVDLPAKSNLETTLGTIPWRDNFYQGKIQNPKFLYYYKDPGKYEIRIGYIFKVSPKMIYSNIATFEVNNTYDGYNGDIIDYLETLDIPHFMYSSWYYGNYLRQNDIFSAGKSAEHIILKFKNSVYSDWTVMYLLESDINSELEISKKLNVEKEVVLLTNSSNNLVREYAKELMK